MGFGDMHSHSLVHPTLEILFYLFLHVKPIGRAGPSPALISSADGFLWASGLDTDLPEIKPDRVRTDRKMAVYFRLGI
uniref:Uncharacterized protein n=1 Tax=Arundo donax TaxID=35708 RepID=A0A0A9AA58_ARUDO